jgi:16S rRNA processing protein RimM
MELVPIGYFSKTHGVKGQLLLKVERDLDLENLKAVFVDSTTGKAPYFITEIKESNQGLIVGLEEISSVEKASSLVNKTAFADASLAEEEEPGEEWTGFELIDKLHGSLGHVIASSHNGAQVLLSFLYKDKEVILPLVEQFIEQVDEENKKIFFCAPEGLIELYLSEED